MSRSVVTRVVCVSLIVVMITTVVTMHSYSHPTQRTKSFLIKDILSSNSYSNPNPNPNIISNYNSIELNDNLFSHFNNAFHSYIVQNNSNSNPIGIPFESNSHNNGSCGVRRVRRNRTVFTELQLIGLETRFDTHKYLSTPDRAELARALGLTQLQVKTWYQNRRMKWKKQVMSGGCPIPPTKPKGRPKKNSIPSFNQSLIQF